MIHRRSALRLVTLAAVALTALPAFAQIGRDPNMAETSTTVMAGDVFEMLGVSADTRATFDWVLTANGSFVEAGRERIFRTRLTQPGTYALDAQAKTEAGDRRLHMTVIVTDRPEGDIPPTDTGLDIVATDASAGTEGIAIDPGHPVLTLTPSSALTGEITLDLDATTDTDGDGDPGNDNDAADTLFATEHNALRLWFAMPETARPMRLKTVAAEGVDLSQDIDILAGGIPVTDGLIDARERGDGRVTFSLSLDPTIDPASIVYQWQFGDGRQSLADAPTHTYFANGERTVTVTVREMATGRELARGSTQITITDAPEPVASSSSSAAASSVSSPAPSQESANSGGSTLWTILKLIAILIVAALIGLGGVWAYRKVLHRESGLQKALEDAENKLLKKDELGIETAEGAPATMQLKRSETPAEETIEQSVDVAKKEEAATPPPVIDTTPVPQPPAEPAPAPAWLQQGMAAAAEQSQTQMTPPQPEPEPVPEPALPGAPAPVVDTTPAPQPQPQPEPEPEPQPEPAPAPTPAATEEGPLPPWMQPAPATPFQPEPQPQAAPAPAPIPTPPAPVVQPQPKPQPVAAPAPMMPTPTTQAPIASVSTTADQERMERERERKRRKRQRYRENLKKRNAEFSGPGSGTGPVEALKPPAETSSPAAPPAPQEKPVAQPKPAPTPGTISPSKPIPQDIPPVTPSPNPNPSPIVSDDKVAFMIKAEGIQKKEEETKKGTADDAHA